MKKIGLVGYGNLGKAVEYMVEKFPDIKLDHIFTRRNPRDILTYNKDASVLPYSSIMSYRDKLDCLILAGGSKSDLSHQSPYLSRYFNIVDSFDDHTEIREHIKAVDKSACEGGKCALVSSGWDPGLFSLMRLYFSSFMPSGTVNTFWGRGVSQGHSEALRGIEGVRYAVQYTVPKKEALLAASRGESTDPRAAHKRICYIVADEEKREFITKEIRGMKNYFLGYETEVNFISEAEFKRHHTALPHGGKVVSHLKLGDDITELAELTLSLDSNPHLTAGILLASARAVCKLYDEGERGAKTVLDIPPRMFCNVSPTSFL
ncbi:MAG: diaminopimelate dehydrogenase [Clostridia bacterium]|nr:diaminopimelate dehydrogenase [Clostridia bacterium]